MNFQLIEDEDGNYKGMRDGDLLYIVTPCPDSTEWSAAYAGSHRFITKQPNLKTMQRVLEDRCITH
jgi:hypothetical protein